VAGRVRSIEKSNDLIGNQTCNLPACSIMPHSTAVKLECLICKRVVELMQNLSLNKRNEEHKQSNMGFTG
jgi:hypothetical protein